MKVRFLIFMVVVSLSLYAVGYSQRIINCSPVAVVEVPKSPKHDSSFIKFDGSGESAEDIANLFIDNKFGEEMNFDPDKKLLEFISDGVTYGPYEVGSTVMLTNEYLFISNSYRFDIFKR